MFVGTWNSSWVKNGAYRRYSQIHFEKGKWYTTRYGESRGIQSLREPRIAKIGNWTRKIAALQRAKIVIQPQPSWGPTPEPQPLSAATDMEVSIRSNVQFEVDLERLAAHFRGIAVFSQYWGFMVGWIETSSKTIFPCPYFGTPVTSGPAILTDSFPSVTARCYVGDHGGRSKLMKKK